MPFIIVRDNIVHMRTDAIVNAANSRLQAGGGVCGSIFSAAGYERMQAACNAIGHCGVGQVVATPGFALPARFVFHAVGPIWRGGFLGEERQLRSCYTQAMRLAVRMGLQSIAFPLISSGIYGYPKARALSTAVSAIGEFLLQEELTVYLVVYDRSAYELSAQRFRSIQSYIDDHYVQMRERIVQPDFYGTTPIFDAWPLSSQPSDTEGVPVTAAMRPSLAKEPPDLGKALTEAVSHLQDTFSQSVLHWIDLRGEKDADVYKRANLDRKLFSKLRSDVHYKPSKATAVALAVALRLNLDETRDLLGRAGYALSSAQRADVIVSFFIEQGNYSIFEINEALFAFDEACLGA